MTNTSEIGLRDCIGQELIGRDGDKIGKISEIFVDDDTNKPAWFAVTTGFFGNKASFVPIAQAGVYDGEITVPYTKGEVKDAPNAESDGHLSREQEAGLYDYYGMSRREAVSEQGPPAGDRGGANDDAMTRSEEELVAGKERRPAGVARLRKWVETEHQTVTVPVQRERVRVEREPISESNIDRALDGPEITDNVHEATLYEEVPVVETKVVPKERVRLEKDVEIDQQAVGADVRKEHIEVEGEDDTA